MEHWISFRDAKPTDKTPICVRWEADVESGCFSATTKNGEILPDYEGVWPYMVQGATHWCLYDK